MKRRISAFLGIANKLSYIAEAHVFLSKVYTHLCQQGICYLVGVIEDIPVLTHVATRRLCQAFRDFANGKLVIERTRQKTGNHQCAW